jgi:ribosome recycling factor
MNPAYAPRSSVDGGRRWWFAVIDPILAEAETKMDKSVDAMQRDLLTIRTGRANPALIDRVMVPYYGTPTPLNQLAQISAPEARMLLVNVYDRSQVGAIEKALRAPELGLNPASDGSVIRVPIPPLTEERRRDYVKMVRQKAEEARVAIRNIRRDEVHRVERMQKEGDLPEDQAKRGLERLQKITDAHIGRVEHVAGAKEAEVMEV